MRKCGGWALVGSQAGVPAVLLVWCLTMEPRWTGMLLGHPCVKWTHWHPWVFERQVHLRGVRTFAYPVKNTDTMVWVVGLEFMGSVLFGGPSHLGFMRWLSRWTYESLSWRCTHTHPHPPTHTPPHPHTHLLPPPPPKQNPKTNYKKTPSGLGAPKSKLQLLGFCSSLSQGFICMWFTSVDASSSQNLKNGSANITLLDYLSHCRLL